MKCIELQFFRRHCIYLNVDTQYCGTFVY